MGGMYVHGRAWTGFFILIIGIIALLKVSNVIPPEWSWIYTWPVFLIGLGLFIGIRHGFHGISWLILILIGSVFLADRVYPNIEMHRYTWPIVLISLGLFFIFRPHRRWHGDPTADNTSDRSASGHLALLRLRCAEACDPDHWQRPGTTCGLRNLSRRAVLHDVRKAPRLWVCRSAAADCSAGPGERDALRP